MPGESFTTILRLGVLVKHSISSFGIAREEARQHSCEMRIWPLHLAATAISLILLTSCALISISSAS
jgi:hypothetical protein